MKNIEDTVSFLRKQILESDNNPQLDEKIQLPIKCEEYDEIAAKIELEKDLNVYLKKSLRLVGGKSIYDTVRRVINKLFEKELQKNINYTGKNNKKKLSSSPYLALILGNM